MHINREFCCRCAYEQLKMNAENVRLSVENDIHYKRYVVFAIKIFLFSITCCFLSFFLTMLTVSSRLLRHCMSLFLLLSNGTPPNTTNDIVEINTLSKIQRVSEKEKNQKQWPNTENVQSQTTHTHTHFLYLLTDGFVFGIWGKSTHTHTPEREKNAPLSESEWEKRNDEKKTRSWKITENACPWIDTRGEWTKRLWPFNFVQEFRLNSSSENSNKCSKLLQIPKLMYCTVCAAYDPENTTKKTQRQERESVFASAICIVFVYMYVCLRCKFKP